MWRLQHIIEKSRNRMHIIYSYVISPTCLGQALAAALQAAGKETAWRQRHRGPLGCGSSREVEDALTKGPCRATRARWPAGRAQGSVSAPDPIATNLPRSTYQETRYIKAAPRAG